MWCRRLSIVGKDAAHKQIWSRSLAMCKRAELVPHVRTCPASCKLHTVALHVVCSCRVRLVKLSLCAGLGLCTTAGALPATVPFMLAFSCWFGG